MFQVFFFSCGLCKITDEIGRTQAETGPENTLCQWTVFQMRGASFLSPVSFLIYYFQIFRVLTRLFKLMALLFTFIVTQSF